MFTGPSHEFLRQSLMLPVPAGTFRYQDRRLFTNSSLTKPNNPNPVLTENVTRVQP